MVPLGARVCSKIFAYINLSILTTSPGGRDSYYPHFTGELTDTEKLSTLPKVTTWRRYHHLLGPRPSLSAKLRQAALRLGCRLRTGARKEAKDSSKVRGQTGGLSRGQGCSLDASGGKAEAQRGWGGLQGSTPSSAPGRKQKAFETSSQVGARKRKTSSLEAISKQPMPKLTSA